MKLHIRAYLTTDKGSLINLSMKQKINTESLTEAKLVGIVDTMNFLVWSKLYFEWKMKDYPDEKSKFKLLGKTNIVQQDNTSVY